MINDLFAWRKAYRGPFQKREAEKLRNGFSTDGSKGIYGSRIKKASNLPLFDVYIKIER